jgi:Bacterial Ig-like domain (group 1)
VQGTEHRAAPGRAWKLLTFLIVPLLALSFAQSVVAADPGVGAGAPEEATPDAAVAADVSINSLNEFTQIVGEVVLSEDACGTNAASCNVDIVKPSAEATVREAHLFCATTGFSGYNPQDDDVTLNGSAVVWDQVIPNAIDSFNARDDVTAIVAPVGDAAAPGIVSFTIAENPTGSYDGCILKVIWDDPTTTTNSILIFFGAQETEGDTFVINFAQPLDADSFLAPLEYSLGISFGAQGCETGQFSLVDVNATRLTSSAGGEDDGSCTNGALITVGGTGDSATNPPPLAPPTSDPAVPDDELYDLRPFLTVGDTSMTVFTLNPSNDDNVFIANFFLRNVFVEPPPPANLVLTPESETNAIGDEHCVTATVTDAAGDPTPGITVQFSVSGANITSGSAVTDADGVATFCYTGTNALPGSDTITAFADADDDGVNDAAPADPEDTASKTWGLPESDADCRVTLGGWIITSGDNRATFGGNANGAGPSGEQEYQDHGTATGINVHSIEILSVTCTDTTATIFGTATIDGAGTFDFRIDVVDNGNPGTTDRYRIRLSNGYDSGSQLLGGGNIVIH